MPRYQREILEGCKSAKRKASASRTLFLVARALREDTIFLPFTLRLFGIVSPFSNLDSGSVSPVIEVIQLKLDPSKGFLVLLDLMVQDEKKGQDKPCQSADHSLVYLIQHRFTSYEDGLSPAFLSVLS